MPVLPNMGSHQRTTERTRLIIYRVNCEHAYIDEHPNIVDVKPRLCREFPNIKHYGALYSGSSIYNWMGGVKTCLLGPSAAKHL